MLVSCVREIHAVRTTWLGDPSWLSAESASDAQGCATGYLLGNRCMGSYVGRHLEIVTKTQSVEGAAVSGDFAGQNLIRK